nr:hypothetical protein GCM10020093_043660 [Planobispora longispora]
MLGGVGLQILHRRVLDDDLPAEPFHLAHPGGHLQPLVHRAGGRVEPGRPVDRPVPAGSGHGELDPVDRRAGVRPQVQAEGALVAEGRPEHGLAGHDPAAADVVRGPVGDDGDVVSVPQQADREVEARLPGADDEDSAHDCVSLPGV